MNTMAKEVSEAAALLTLNITDNRDAFCEALAALGLAAEERLKNANAGCSEDEWRENFVEYQGSHYDDCDKLEEEFQEWLANLFVRIGNVYVHEADVGGLDDIAHDLTWSWMTKHLEEDDPVKALHAFITKNLLNENLDTTIKKKPIAAARKM